MDYICYALAMIEISKACASCGVIMSVCNSLYDFPVYKYGTEEQKQKFLRPVASGEALGCYGLTEAGAGSDPAKMLTTAVPNGDEWVINGTKRFITKRKRRKVLRSGCNYGQVRRIQGHKFLHCRFREYARFSRWQSRGKAWNQRLRDC